MPAAMWLARDVIFHIYVMAYYRCITVCLAEERVIPPPCCVMCGMMCKKWVIPVPLVHMHQQRTPVPPQYQYRL